MTQFDLYNRLFTNNDYAVRTPTRVYYPSPDFSVAHGCSKIEVGEPEEGTEATHKKQKGMKECLGDQYPTQCQLVSACAYNRRGAQQRK
ncbi:hypothetical protein AG1IA_00089 [Rhizoctonia solani AG-1 IA]|uniref:Uncharacterized protein n=1 Tax=Thanatephorus cucumeris (strain AG1-IA) TaxID=983506 RepID=L8X6G1_THACA|nr:hypothetical protein AG1IA_00089 [Rhizoctonia solani AG-1 IA]